MFYILFLIGLVQGALYNLNDSEKLFEDFVQKYNKSYSSEEERQIKFDNFKNNIRSINEKNSLSNSAVYDINFYSDMNKNELLRKQTGFKINLKKNNLDLSWNIKCNKKLINGNPAVLLPDSFDWRDRHVITSVKNQRDCGSCWAFSTIANIESLYAIKYNKLLDLSEQQLVNCDEQNNGCNGGLMHWAMEEIIRQGGVSNETDFPYTASDGFCKRKQGFVNINGCNQFILSNEDRLRELLIFNGPISIAIDVIDVIDYSQGISSTCRNDNGLNHAVLLVGYGVKNNIPYWILKNSWGSQWGENGYFRVQRNINSCGMINDYAASAIL
ncbi:ORF31 [Agrotis segetum granulovirus]|uniref:Viral cathepsin n=1 Tax=Agrotis segetum granulosis virus TaxID=10464 RepID=Q6QXF0_GVAS|nr:ORF31 [Agrotis segetum granulovirus]